MKSKAPTTSIITKKEDCSLISSFSSIICTITLSILTVHYNKKILTHYEFSPQLLLIFQLSIATVFLHFAKSLKLIEFTKTAEPITPRTLLCTLPLGLTFGLNIMLGCLSLQATSVHMYTTLRRLNIPTFMAIEILLVNKRPSFWIIFSGILTIVGAILVSLYDIDGDFGDYSLVLCYNLINAGYLMIASRTEKALGLTTYGLMYSNNIVCLPILLAIAIHSDGSSILLLHQNHLPISWWPLIPDILLNCMFSFLVNFALYFNTSKNGPSCNVVCGNLRDFLLTGYSFLALNGCNNDVPELSLLGNCFGFCSCFIYSIAKIMNYE
eukprot:TRINITY_DN7827_c0_g1_i1.p1 TRINITY_DN7827_c0_g1~~TRINITY_DN7827_c0_g1_i1.p1  ORF type:complete len:325 (+),score=14.31 TRINITY_DN7827_c0_g1_i1:1-975(+)